MIRLSFYESILSCLILHYARYKGRSWSKLIPYNLYGISYTDCWKFDNFPSWDQDRPVHEITEVCCWHNILMTISTKVPKMSTTKRFCRKYHIIIANFKYYLRHGHISHIKWVIFHLFSRNFIKLTLTNVKIDIKEFASSMATNVKFPLQIFSLPSRYLPGEQLTK